MKKESQFYNCPYCGGRVSKNYKFCIYCAKQLKGGPEIKKAEPIAEFIEDHQIKMF